MKKYLLGLLLFTATQISLAYQFTSFDDVTESLSNGNEINILVDLANCKIDDPNSIKIPPAKWFARPEAVIFTDELISMDGVKYTHGRKPLPKNGLMQRANIIAGKNGTADITLSFFDVRTNEKFMKDVKIACKLHDGLKFFSRR